MQPRSDSRIADSLASRLEQLVRRLSREHLTVGIILLVLGVFAFQISPWLAWFTIGSGLLLLTWHARIRNTYRGLLYFIALLPVLHWFNSINEFLFHEDAVTGMMLSRDSASPLELVYGLIFAVVAIGGLIFVIRHRPYVRAIQAATGGTGNRQNKQARWSNVPARTFADVGGMDDQKTPHQRGRAKPALPREIQTARGDSKRHSSVWTSWNGQDLPGRGDGGRVQDQLLVREADQSH